jgi:hypothetical protein
MRGAYTHKRFGGRFCDSRSRSCFSCVLRYGRPADARSSRGVRRDFSAFLAHARRNAVPNTSYINPNLVLTKKNEVSLPLPWVCLRHESACTLWVFPLRASVHHSRARRAVSTDPLPSTPPPTTPDGSPSPLPRSTAHPPPLRIPQTHGVRGRRRPRSHAAISIRPLVAVRHAFVGPFLCGRGAPPLFKPGAALHTGGEEGRPPRASPSPHPMRPPSPN